MHLYNTHQHRAKINTSYFMPNLWEILESIARIIFHKKLFPRIMKQVGYRIDIQVDSAGTTKALPLFTYLIIFRIIFQKTMPCPSPSTQPPTVIIIGTFFHEIQQSRNYSFEFLRFLESYKSKFDIRYVHMYLISDTNWRAVTQFCGNVDSRSQLSRLLGPPLT